MLEQIARQNEVELLRLRVLEKRQHSGLMYLHSSGCRRVNLLSQVHRNSPGRGDTVDEVAIAGAQFEDHRFWRNELSEVCSEMAPERVALRIAGETRGEVGAFNGRGHFQNPAAAHVARETV